MKRLTHLLGFLIIGAMVAYLAQQQDLIATLGSISLASLLVVLLLTVLSTAVYGSQFSRSCEVFDVVMPYGQALGLAVTNTMLNYAMPLKGGTIIRAAYMKQRYGLVYTAYGALLASSQLVSIGAAGTIGLVLASLAWLLDGFSSALIWAVLGASTVGSALAYRLVEAFDFTRVRPPAVGRKLGLFSDGFRRWRRHPRLVLSYSATVGGSIVLQGARLVVIFTALGTDVPIMSMMVVSTVVVISGALSITPGNLGIKEGVIAVSAGLLGTDLRVALLASLVDRAAGVLVTVALGLVFSQTLLRGWRTTSTDLPPGQS